MVRGVDRSPAHLLSLVNDLDVALIVVVVIVVPGLVDGELQVVDAQAVPLSISIRDQARLQQLVIAGSNACSTAATISNLRATAQRELNVYMLQQCKDAGCTSGATFQAAMCRLCCRLPLMQVMTGLADEPVCTRLGGMADLAQACWERTRSAPPH